MKPDQELVDRIIRMANLVEEHADAYGPLSTGERIAVALVLNRPELLKKDAWTMLAAVDRLGPEWTAAALTAQRTR